MANILVVDDDPKARELLAAVLGFLGYGGHQLRETADGAEALTVIQTHRPDLIIADLLMPTMDGFEFVRQLRLKPEFSRTPVVFYTAGYIEAEARKLAHACGVRHIITKPAEPEQILRIVSSVLGSSSAQVQMPPIEEFRQEQLKLLTSALLNVTSSDLPRMQALVDLLCRIITIRKTQQLLQVACSSTRMMVGARYAIIALQGTTQGMIKYRNATGMQEGIAEILTNPHREYSARRNVYHPIRLEGITGKPQEYGLPAEHPPIGSLMTIPIAIPAQTYGWICLSNRIGLESFSENDQLLASIVGTQVANLIELLEPLECPQVISAQQG